MSHDHEILRLRIGRLRRTRDQLYLKVHLGQMDAREFWDDLEKRLNHLEANAKHLTQESEDALDDVAGVVRDHITELREGYDRLASMLRETSSETLWSQVRSTFDRLVERGHRATERVGGSFTELGDAAKVRLEKARLERMLIKKCAELGTQVYQLANGQGLPDGRPPQVLDDVGEGAPPGGRFARRRPPEGNGRAPRAPTGPSMTPHPTVVLVDGNPFQRGQNEAALHRAGYDTIALATPSQALSLCDREAVPIDAFVVTSSHGQVRGLDLVRDIRARRGPLPALLVWEDREPAPTDLHGVAVLVRPYATGFLTEELTRLLGSSRVRELRGRDDELTTVDAGERATPGMPDVGGTGTAARPTSDPYPGHPC